MKNFNLDPTRMYHFLRRQLVLNVSSMWIAFGAIFGSLLIITFLTARFNPMGVAGMPALYLTVLFITGYIFTSRIFSEMNRPAKAYLFLTLPVSPAEKLFGSWLVAGPVFVIAFTLLSYLMYEAGKLIAGFTMEGASFPAFFDVEVFRTLGIFLITQSIFFLGACTFKGNNFLKTIFSLFLISVILLVFMSIVAALFVYGTYNKYDFSLEFKGGSDALIDNVIPVFFWYVLGPFMLLVSYFKLKEREI